MAKQSIMDRVKSNVMKNMAPILDQFMPDADQFIPMLKAWYLDKKRQVKLKPGETDSSLMMVEKDGKVYISTAILSGSSIIRMENSTDLDEVDVKKLISGELPI